MEKKPPGRPPKSGSTFGVRIEIRATAEERDRFDQAASLAEIERSDWIRNTLNSAANLAIEEHGDTQKLKTPKESSKKGKRRAPPGTVNES